MKMKLLTLLTGILGATAAHAADVHPFDDYQLETTKAAEANTCRYVGVGVGLPHIDLDLGARKQWGFNGFDVGINAETTSTIEKKIGDQSQLLGFANYLLYPAGTPDARFYLGAGGTIGRKFTHGPEITGETVGGANLLIGRSFTNRQFIQAKVGVPLEYNESSPLYFERVDGTTPTLTVSYGIGF